MKKTIVSIVVGGLVLCGGFGLSQVVMSKTTEPSDCLCKEAQLIRITLEEQTKLLKKSFEMMPPMPEGGFQQYDPNAIGKR